MINEYELRTMLKDSLTKCNWLWRIIENQNLQDKLFVLDWLDDLNKISVKN